MRFHLQLALLIIAFMVLGCHQSGAVPEQDYSDAIQSKLPGLSLSSVARSPELVMVGRLRRGIDDRGILVFGTRLLDGTAVCIESTPSGSFGQWYQTYFIAPDGLVSHANFNLPRGHVPMGFVYAHALGEKHLVICHRELKPGIVQSEKPYYLSNDGSEYAVAFEFLNYNRIDKPKVPGSSITGYSIAEAGFCVNKKGQVLWPGELEQGELYLEFEDTNPFLD